MSDIIDEVSASYVGKLSQPFLNFARRQLVNASGYSSVEVRSEERQPMMLPAVVVAIDDFDHPLGEVHEVVTRDVASTSIGLLHEEALKHKRVALRMMLAGAEVNLVLQIVWQSEMGPYFGSAGWYVKKLNEFPAEIPAHLTGGSSNCSLPNHTANTSISKSAKDQLASQAEEQDWEGDIETARRIMK